MKKTFKIYQNKYQNKEQVKKVHLRNNLSH